MAVLTDVVLVADGGDITAGRQTSTLTFGEFNVVLPEGVERREGQDSRIKDGYVYRPEGDFGPFDVGFARADVTVDLQAQTSDLEATVDAAQRQADGDVFFERDITIVGLGEFVPGVDFQVGDIVTVELWGGLVRLLLPVSDVTLVSSESEGAVAWRVHVGGMLVSDAVELQRSNDELRRQVKQDRRQLSEVKSVASGARSDASAARVAADAAVAAVGEAEGVIQGFLAEALAAEERGRGYAKEVGEKYVLAVGAYESAKAALAEVERLLGESDGILDKNSALAKEIRRLHEQVGVMHSAMVVTARDVGVLVGEAQSHVVVAEGAAVAAAQSVVDAKDVAAGVGVQLGLARDAVAQGRKYVTAAQEAAGKAGVERAAALAQAQRAKQLADEASATLAQVRELKTGADAAVVEASETLRVLQGEAAVVAENLSRIDQLQNELLVLHQDVLDKHGLVLAAHDEAIEAVAAGVRAAAASAGSAALGAMWAQQTADDAARVARLALDVGEANTEAIRLLREAQVLHGQAIEDLAAAQAGLAEATRRLVEAGQLQEKLNQDILAQQDRLAQAQRVLEEQTENLRQAQALTNQAVRAVGAAAGFAAQTGMYAADVGERATRVAEEALNVGAANRETQAALAEIVKRSDQTAADAKATADGVAGALAARDEAAKIGEFYAAGSANIQMNALDWNWQRRTQMHFHVGAKEEVFGGLLRVWSPDDQRSIKWEALGGWLGKVVMISEGRDRYGNNPEQTVSSWGVGPDFRSGTVKREQLLKPVAYTLILVEVWIPDKPVFLLPVDTGTGRFIPTTLYDSVVLTPFKFLADGRVKLNFPWSAEISPWAELSGATLKAKKARIPGTALDVWPPYVAVKVI
ncbi:hypothetical protein [Corynebacterium riegelii]|uniref:hypothetical protein n=1 Tax=Corynebacterium riegelii TaxID=156976 RepID=UPI00288A04BB|nr:hypothetical protein [Corynebacterium riegelii]